MSIRLTDLDQDEKIPIETIRDPIGVLLVDEEGWSAVSVKAGISENRSGPPTGLPGGINWITNNGFEANSGLKLSIGRADIRLKTYDWFKPDLEEMLEDWGTDRSGRTARAELLAGVTDRIMRLTYELVRDYAGLSPTKEQALLNTIERSGGLATGLRTVLAPEMDATPMTEQKLVAATKNAIKFGAFNPEEAQLSDGELMVRLRPPRFAYSQSVLSRRVPAQGKWQQARLEDKDLLTEEALASLRGLNRPVLITGRAEQIKGAEDPLLASWTLPFGSGFVRKTYTLEEVDILLRSYRFRDPIVMVGPGWTEPAARQMLRGIETACGVETLAEASWSAGVLAENILCAAMRSARPLKGGSEGAYTPESVWIAASDRIEMLPYTRALQGFGCPLIGGYAGGVRFKAPEDPEMVGALLNGGWECGLYTQVSMVRRMQKWGATLHVDPRLYGGDPERAMFPFMSQSGRVKLMWQINEILGEEPERRPEILLNILSGKA